MEFASKLRWILVIVVSVIFLILVCWGLYSIARNTFSPNDEDGTSVSEQEQVDEGSVRSTARAVYTVDGPIVANNEHRSYRIEVTNNSVVMKVYSGYGSSVIAESSYPNTSDSYTAFLSALSNANVTALARGASDQDEFAEIGACATGRKFIVELDSTLRRWSTSCNRVQGNAGFTMSQVGSLFQRQVPDYSTLVRGTGL